MGGDERAINAMVGRLEDQNEYVRRAAVKVLGQIAEKGDQHTITAVSACLEDREWEVMWAAAAALPKIAEKRDNHAITALKVRLAKGGTEFDVERLQKALSLLE